MAKTKAVVEEPEELEEETAEESAEEGEELEETEEAEETEEKPAEEGKTKKEKDTKTYITTKELSKEHGVKPAYLRRFLRTLPKFKDGGYTRYKWEPGDKFLGTIAEGLARFKEKEKERNAKRLADLKAKEAAKKTGDVGAKKVEPKKKVA